MFLKYFFEIPAICKISIKWIRVENINNSFARTIQAQGIKFSNYNLALLLFAIKKNDKNSL
jgi:hypothetical protein